VDNAMIACDFINCNNVIGMHYDTFGYIKIDKSEAVAKFTRQGKKLTLLEIGETIQK
jgi:L-ascorbate metabolism protein UlaG (beta-lactamase superfamily)